MLSTSLLPAAAWAQDSVAATPGLPGDGIFVFGLGGIAQEQVNDYTLRLTPLTSSWGGRYAIGPMAKASRSNAAGYFNMILGAQAASGRFGASPFLRTSYATWLGAGPGVSSTGNTNPGSVSTVGLVGRQFGAAFAEFSAGVDQTFGTLDDDQHIISSIVGFTSAEPNTLYISRINALSNKPSNGNNASASLGLGSIDELGNVHAYADAFGLTTANRLTQRAMVRVASASRSVNFVNRVQNSGFGDAAASSFVRLSDTPMTVPAIISGALPGGAGRPVLLATDLASNLITEPAANSTATTKAYLPGAVGSARGTLGFIPQLFPPLTGTGAGGVGIGATIVRTDGNTKARGIQLFGVTSTGTPINQLQITLPATPSLLIDPSDGFSPGAIFPPLADHEFTNTASQLPFRGGASPVASVVLPSGDLLVSALISPIPGSKTPQSQDNALAVARITASGTTWSIAAHTGNVLGSAGGLSKAILGDFGGDGLPNTSDAGEGDGVVDAAPIGRIARASEVFDNATTGPSISSAAFDRAGNLYFTSTVALNSGAGPVYTTALLRANRRSVGDAYDLELLVKLGDVFQGLDSTRNYQIQSLGISDSDSGESGALFSGNIVQDLVPGVSLGTQPAASPMALGALVFRAKVVYDTNNSGTFIDPSLSAGSVSPDEAYNVALVLMPRILPGDFDRSGSVTADDIFSYLDVWFAQNGQSGNDLLGDFNADGSVDADDIFAYLDAWFAAV